MGQMSPICKIKKMEFRNQRVVNQSQFGTILTSRHVLSFITSWFQASFQHEVLGPQVSYLAYFEYHFYACPQNYEK
jgi:hypothetical protein